MGGRAAAGLAALTLIFGSLIGLAGARPAAAGVGTTVYLPNITKMLGGADGWQTPFIVQNVGTDATSVTVEFYSFSDGSLVKTRTVPSLAPGNSFAHDPNSDTGLPAGGQFSVVIRSAASPVVAVVNEHQNVSNQARQEALSYAGLSGGSTKLYAPYFANNVGGWITTLIVQNLGAAATTATLAFTSYDGTIVAGQPSVSRATVTRLIAPGRAAFVDPRAEAGLLPGVEYSVTLTASQPIGAVINAHNDAATVAAPMGFSYNAVAASSSTDTYVPYAARNADGVGRYTRLLVQNIATSAATPALYFRSFGSTIPQRVSAPAPLAPGATWSVDLRTQPLASDGEYSVHVTNESMSVGGVTVTSVGQFAVVAATISPTTAMGYTGSIPSITKWFLPNVTRTLGGASGWTTPIVLQSTGDFTTTARLSWYRFSDGTLVTTQNVSGLSFGTSVRVDPRSVPGLADDTQYSVVVEAPIDGIVAIVTELNTQGGDGAMAYEGFPVASTAPFGTSSCSPGSGPVGTTFRCQLYGLTPGSSVSYKATITNGGTGTLSGTSTAASDGSFVYFLNVPVSGTVTFTATAGATTATTSIVVTGATFGVTVGSSANGSLSVTTLPSIPCVLVIAQPDGTPIDTGYATVISNSAGVANFIYPKLSSPTGTYTHLVICTLGSTSRMAFPTFSVP